MRFGLMPNAWGARKESLLEATFEDSPQTESDWEMLLDHYYDEADLDKFSARVDAYRAEFGPEGRLAKDLTLRTWMLERRYDEVIAQLQEEARTGDVDVAWANNWAWDFYVRNERLPDLLKLLETPQFAKDYSRPVLHTLAVLLASTGDVDGAIEALTAAHSRPRDLRPVRSDRSRPRGRRCGTPRQGRFQSARASDRGNRNDPGAVPLTPVRLAPQPSPENSAPENRCPALQRCSKLVARGGVAERLKALVLKTSIPRGIQGSNPCPSAI